MVLRLLRSIMYQTDDDEVTLLCTVPHSITRLWFMDLHHCSIYTSCMGICECEAEVSKIHQRVVWGCKLMCEQPISPHQ